MPPDSLQRPRVRDDFRLFVLERPGRFADGLACALGAPAQAHEDRTFEDGEHKLRPLASVRDGDVFVVQSLYAEPGESAHDKLVKLLFFIGALKDAAARRVTAVVPYLAYARKDRKSKPRDPVATRYVAQLFESVGTDGVVTIDVHNIAAFQNAFRCRTEHVEASELLVLHCVGLIGDDRAAIIAPDAGGIRRAENFRQRMEAALHRPIGMGFAEKHRSEGAVTGQAFLGEVHGSVAVIVDDLVSSGTTLARTAAMCRERGASSVIAAVTHGVFAGANDILSDAAIDRIVVTDTIAPVRVSSPALQAKLSVVSIHGLLAEVIRRLHCGESLVALQRGNVPARQAAIRA